MTEEEEREIFKHTSAINDIVFESQKKRLQPESSSSFPKFGTAIEKYNWALQKQRQGQPALNVKIDNLIEKQQTTNFGATKPTKEEIKMSPEYSDGSFKKNIRKSGLMRYQFMYNSKRETVYGHSEHECWKKREEFVSGKYAPKKHKAMAHTVGSMCNWYYETYRKSQCKKAKTRENNERMINEIATALPYDIKKIDSDHIQIYLNSISSTPNKRKKIRGMLYAAFEKAFRKKWIKENPLELVEIERHIPKGHPVLQFADQRKVFEYFEDIKVSDPSLFKKRERYLKFYMIACCTGLREAELLNSLDNIDFNLGYITVQGEDTQTKRHYGEIPFLPELISERDIQLIKTITLSGVQSYFKMLFRKLGIKAVVHSFRVTFISVCNFLNYNPKQIQALARHASVSMTMDTYAKLLKTDGTSPILEYLKKLKEELKL